MTKEPETDGPGVDVDALYLEERSGLVRLGFLLTGSSETAEDVVQDAFERCLPRLDGVDQPGAYLRTAVVNSARSKVRRERSAPMLPRPMAAELGESALDLWAALRTLSERRRTAMVLRHWVDLPVIEIAEVMGCRPGTVSSWLHRGLADLREELADD